MLSSYTEKAKKPVSKKKKKEVFHPAFDATGRPFVPKPDNTINNYFKSTAAEEGNEEDCKKAGVGS
jgi:hypothetical protein